MTNPKLKPSDYIKKGWCQGQYAKDAKGYPVPCYTAAAVSWCIDGAFMAAGLGMPGYISLSIPQPYTIGSWNDAPGRTQAEVIAMLEKHGF